MDGWFQTASHHLQNLPKFEVFCSFKGRKQQQVTMVCFLAVGRVRQERSSCPSYRSMPAAFCKLRSHCQELTGQQLWWMTENTDLLQRGCSANHTGTDRKSPSGWHLHTEEGKESWTFDSQISSSSFVGKATLPKEQSEKSCTKLFGDYSY